MSGGNNDNNSHNYDVNMACYFEEEEFDEASFDIMEDDDGSDGDSTYYSYYTTDEGFLSTIWEETSEDLDLDDSDDCDCDSSISSSCSISINSCGNDATDEDERSNNTTNNDGFDTPPSHPRRSRSLSPVSPRKSNHNIRSLSPLGYKSPTYTTKQSLNSFFGNSKDNFNPTSSPSSSPILPGGGDGKLGSFLDASIRCNAARQQQQHRTTSIDRTIHKDCNQVLGETFKRTQTTMISSSPSFEEEEEESVDDDIDIDIDEYTFVSCNTSTDGDSSEDLSSCFSFASDDVSLDVSLSTYDDELYYIRKQQAEIDQEKLQQQQQQQSNKGSLSDSPFHSSMEMMQPLHTIPEDNSTSEHTMSPFSTPSQCVDDDSQRRRRSGFDYEQSRKLLKKRLNLKATATRKISMKENPRKSSNGSSLYAKQQDLKLKFKLERLGGQRRHINYQRSKKKLLKKLETLKKKSRNRGGGSGGDDGDDPIITSRLLHNHENDGKDNNNKNDDERPAVTAALERFGGLQRSTSFKKSKQLLEDSIRKSSNELLSPGSRGRSGGSSGRGQRRNNSQQRQRQRSLSPTSIDKQRKERIRQSFSQLLSKSRSESHLNCNENPKDDEQDMIPDLLDLSEESISTSSSSASSSGGKLFDVDDEEEEDDEEEDAVQEIDTSRLGAMKRRHKIERYDGYRRRSSYERSKKSLKKNMKKMMMRNQKSTATTKEALERFGGLHRMESYRKTRELFKASFSIKKTTGS